MQLFFYIAHLLSCAIHQSQPLEKPDHLDWEQLYTVCQQNSITSTVYQTLLKLETPPNNLMLWEQDFQKAFIKEVSFDKARETILHEFQTYNIPYLLLKGIVLKQYYPGIGFRTFADNDILCNRQDQKKILEIMNKLSYQCVDYHTDSVNVYQKPPVFNFEIHFSLFPSSNPLSKYFANTLEDYQSIHQYERKMSKEQYYIYLIAHLYKHYTRAGVGIRYLLDVYIFYYAEQHCLDTDYLLQEFSKLQLTAFEQEVRTNAFSLFSDCTTLLSMDNKMLRYISKCALYGTTENKVKNLFVRTNQSKFQYLCHRFFPNKEMVNTHFPATKKYKALYPVGYTVTLGRRTLHGICQLKKISKELMLLHSIDKKKH